MDAWSSSDSGSDEAGNEESPSLEGMMLVANPSLMDPNFRRTLIYLPAHESDDGAMGLILNRPLDKVTGDLVSDLKLDELRDVPVFHGGPVGENHLTFAALDLTQAGEEEGKVRHISMSEAIELHDSPLHIVRAYVGYSGWASGQLEQELKQNAWLLHKPTFDDLNIDSQAPQKAWHEIIGRFGPVYRLLAQAPDDPSLN